MAIPKVIYQTFKTQKLPLVHQWHISRFKAANQSYQYQFFTDERIEDFLATEYGAEVINAYKRLQIGAAKADFFRYAILYKKGGIYLDIDSTIKKPLHRFITDSDSAVVSFEKNGRIYVQWALIYGREHPFLERTLHFVLQNIKENKYPHDVHQMTGPSVYTKAITKCLLENPNIPHRLLGVDYNGFFKFKFPLSKMAYQKGGHWKEEQKLKPVLKPL